MAQVIDGRIMSIGELLGGAAQDSNGAQLHFEQVKGSYPPIFEAKGTDNNIYSFEMTSMLARLSVSPILSLSGFKTLRVKDFAVSKEEKAKKSIKERGQKKKKKKRMI
jgi:hypothetical protein